MAEAQVIDFDQMNFEGKKNYIEIYTKATNLFDLLSKGLDWSTSTMPPFVSSEIVLSFLRTIDFNRVCNELKGKKTMEEVLLIVLRF